MNNVITLSFAVIWLALITKICMADGESEPLQNTHEEYKLRNAVVKFVSKFQRNEPNTSFGDIIVSYDRVNGGNSSDLPITTLANGVMRVASAKMYGCSGACCSKNSAKYSKSTKTMLSRWLTNAMYDGAQVHIWTWKRNSYWGPSDKKYTNWNGRLTGVPNQPLRSTANSLTVVRLTASTIRLRAPGGRYVEARKDGKVYFNSRATSGTVLRFIQVGSGHVQFKTIFGTFISLGSSDYMYHWSKKAGAWETMLIYEVKNVPSFRGVNLGSWLLPESWMTPSLWDGLPTIIDGFQFQIQSVSTKKWVKSSNGKLVCSVTGNASSDIFVLRRVGSPTGNIQFRKVATGAYYAPSTDGTSINYVSSLTPDRKTQFIWHKNPSNPRRVILQSVSGKYVRVFSGRLQADVNPGKVDLRSASTWKSKLAFHINQVGSMKTTYQICSGLGQTRCTSRMKKHWSSWIVESDWQWIKKQGLNAVRLPIGYWITQMNSPDYPFPSGGYVYLDWAFKMAVKYNIRIFISMHSAPFSNNAIETRDGMFEFTLIPGSVSTMYAAVDWVAKRYASNPMFAGINLINEPYSEILQQKLINYYTQTTAIVRKYSKCAFVSFNHRVDTSPGEYKNYPSFPNQASNVIQDQHIYKVFNPKFNKKSISQTVKAVQTEDKAWLQGIERDNFWIAMVGEFSNSLYVTPPKLSSFEPYATAQMTTYGKFSQAGWFFWAYKTDPIYEGGWSFRYGVEHGYIKKSKNTWP